MQCVVEGEASGLQNAAGEGHASKGTYRKWGPEVCEALAKDKTAVLTLISCCSRGLWKKAFQPVCAYYEMWLIRSE